MKLIYRLFNFVFFSFLSIPLSNFFFQCHVSLLVDSLIYWWLSDLPHEKLFVRRHLWSAPRNAVHAHETIAAFEETISNLALKIYITCYVRYRFSALMVSPQRHPIMAAELSCRQERISAVTTII